MSGYAPDGTTAPPRDPLLKFLGGCALVAGALVALAVIVGGIAAWRLVRDDTPPGRPVEPFLLDDDTGYWSLDLRPDDPGLEALVGHLPETAERVRREADPRSARFSVSIPRRRDDLGRLLPMTAEIASGPQGWAVRVTMSKQLLRLRAALRILRWLMSRGSDPVSNEEIDGVVVSTVRERGTPKAAFGMVGNRILVAERPDRLRALLSLRPSTEAPERPSARATSAIERYHESVRRAGEIGWGFRERLEVPGEDPHRCVGRAAASFALDAEGALGVVAIAEASGGGECRAAALDGPAARAIVAALVPGIDPAEIALREGSPRRSGDDAWRIEATVPEIAKRLDDAIGRLVAEHAAAPSEAAERETPPAIPPPPSPPTTSGPRSGTPSASPSAGTPTPGR